MLEVSLSSSLSPLHELMSAPIELQPRVRLIQQTEHGRPHIRVPNVNFVPMRTKDSVHGVDRNASFGQRMSGATSGSKFRGGRRDTIRQSEDGGMEISWTPSASAVQDEPERDRSSSRKSGMAQKAKRKGVESFGAGMERGGTDEVEVAEAERKGRTQRRKGIRSGSKNVFRNMSS